MRVVFGGIKAWVIGLMILFFVIVVLLVILNLFLFLLPLFLVLVLLGYFFRMLNKVKKEKPKDYVDVKYKKLD